MSAVPFRIHRRRVLRLLLAGSAGLALHGCGGGGDNDGDGSPEHSFGTFDPLPAQATLDDVRYRVVLLPLDRAVALNNKGEVAGGLGSHLVVYSNGSVSDLGTLDGNIASAFDINDSGQITGGFQLPGTDLAGVAFLYDGGVIRRIGTLGGRWSIGIGINVHGDIAGESETGRRTTHAFVYSNGRMRDLGSFAGSDYSAAHGINDSGQVTGQASLPVTRNGHMFVYEGGVMHDLGTIGGSSSVGRAINNRGWIAGESMNASGARRAVLYRDGHMRDLGVLPGGGNTSLAYGINNLGWVVGISTVNPTDRPSHAFVYDGASMRDLASLLIDGTNWDVLFPSRINDAGQVLAVIERNDCPPGSARHVALLVPVLRGMASSIP